MEVVSKLFKTEMKVEALVREKDKLVMMGDPSDWMSAKSYIAADEIGEMIPKILGWSLFSFIFLFPIYFIKGFLQKEDLQDRMNTFGIVTSLVLVLVMIFIGIPYLRSSPVIASLALFFFAISTGLGAFITERKSLVYTTAILFTLAYFSFITKYGFGLFYHPTFSVFLILLLFFVGFVLNKKKEGVFHPAFSSFGIFVVLYYTIYLMIYFFDYYPLNMWAIIFPAFGFSVFFLLRFLVTKRVRCLANSLIFFTTGYLLTLYNIRGLLVSYYGLFLVVLGLLISFIGVFLQRKQMITVKMASAFYWIGLTVCIISFFYAFFNSTSMFFTISLFVAGCFTLSQLISTIPLEDKEEEGPFQENIVMTLFNGAHIATYSYLFLLFYYNFPLGWGAVLTSLFLSITLLVMGAHVKEPALVKRSQYIYLFGILISISYLTALAKFNPLGNYAFNMALTVPLFLLFLYFSYFYREKQNEISSVSFAEVSYFIAVLIFILPILNNENIIFVSSALTLGLLCIYLGNIFLNKDYNLFYSLPIFFSALFYNLFKGLKLDDPLIGILFVFPGLLAMSLGIYFQEKRRLLSNILFFAWFLISAISFALTLNLRSVNLYCLAIWGASYVFGSSFILTEKTAESEGA
ncbi:MAG: hypothetical protein SV062_11820 [Thermodesulfobacteriota bacterium]|nr:hypothetical protein [Thermodesulfobacteriota bacterium]